MEYKKTILILLIVFLFLLFGCPGNNPVCGNSVCEFSEDDSSSSYYCPADCGLTENGMLTLYVFDKNGLVSNANVTVYSAQNWELIKSGITDMSGVYSESFKEGNYTISVNKEGYLKGVAENVSVISGLEKRVELELISTSGLDYCSGEGKQVLTSDSDYINLSSTLKQKWFYWYSCDGNVIPSIDGNCCVGRVNSNVFNVSSSVPLKENFPFKVVINFSDGEVPKTFEYTNILGEMKSFDTEELDKKNPFIEIDEKGSTGVKEVSVKFNDGNFTGKTAVFDINILNEQEIAQMCSDLIYPSIDSMLLKKSEDKPIMFKSSGTMQTIFDEHGKSYAVDKWILNEFSTINGRKATPLELENLSLTNSYIIELKEAPATSSVNLDNIVKSVSTSAYYIELLNAYAKIKARIPQIELAQNQVIQKIQDFEVQIESRYKYSFNGFSITINEGESKQVLSVLKNDSRVKNIYPNTLAKAILDESVSMIDANYFWDYYQNKGSGMKIGIIDTGVDYTHPDLGGCFGESCKVKGGFDFVNNDSDPMDDHGHGTHCAGIAASNGSLKGVAPEAYIYSLKVLNQEGSGYYDDIIEAIEWSMDPNKDGDISDHLDVISLSLGGSGDADDALSTSIDNASNAGIIPVVAAGNEGQFGYYTIGSPGSARKAITVGAVLNPNEMAYFTSKGPSMSLSGYLSKPDVSAPGVAICSSQYASAWDSSKCFDDKHVSISGTSMATPHVAGVAALLKKQKPFWSNADIKSAIVTTALDVPFANTFTQGAGLINAISASNAKLSFYPTSLDFNSSSSLKINVKNISSKKQKFIFPKEVNLYSVRDDKSVLSTLSYSQNSVCLEVGQSVEVNAGISVLEYGLFGGKIPVKIQENCLDDSNSYYQNILASYSKSKNINITLKRDFDYLLNQSNMLDYQTDFIAIDSEGKYVASKSVYGRIKSDTSKITQYSLRIFDDLNSVTFLVRSMYIDGYFSPVFNIGSKQIDLSNGENSIVLDETEKQVVTDNYEEFFKDKKLVQNLVEFALIPKIDGVNPIIAKSAITFSAMSQDSFCSEYSKKFTLNKFLVLDGELEFKVVAGATKVGDSITDANELYFYTSKSVFPNKLDLIFTSDNEKYVDFKINELSPFVNSSLLGLSPYLNTQNFIIAFNIPVFVKNKRLFYSDDNEVGYWVIAMDEVKTNNPVIASKDWASYVFYFEEFFNGKLRTEFNMNWEDIPTGEMVDSIEFYKSPLTFGGALLNYNGYLQVSPIIKTSHKNSPIHEKFWDLYTFDYIEKFRLGKIKVTTPSGQVIDSNGLNFFLNCNNSLGWPLIPCEDGDYTITVGFDGKFFDNSDSKTYVATMKDSYWIIN